MNGDDRQRQLDGLVPDAARALALVDDQTAIPAIAKDAALTQAIEEAVHRLPTRHDLRVGDARALDFIPDNSAHLVLCSPPYWTLKRYQHADGQLGAVADYEAFLIELDKAWRHVYRVLVPGGRPIVVVGDVCLSQR